MKRTLRLFVMVLLLIGMGTAAHALIIVDPFGTATGSTGEFFVGSLDIVPQTVNTFAVAGISGDALPLGVMDPGYNQQWQATAFTLGAGTLANLCVLRPLNIVDGENGWIPEDDGVNHDPNNGAPVPEPSTFLLLGAGLVGLGIVRHRRNKVKNN